MMTRGQRGIHSGSGLGRGKFSSENPENGRNGTRVVVPVLEGLIEREVGGAL